MTGNAENRKTDADFPVLKGIDIDSVHQVGRRSEWLAGKQVALGRSVAVKRLKADLSGSFDIREAFIAAARQAASIVHPAALAVINIFPEQDAIVMEWCGAEPLRRLAGRLNGLEASRLGVAVLDGLAALHATDRAHGNLSPGNVFRDLDGQVKMDDFFQPPLVDGHAETERRFIAPEVLAGGAPDWRSDLYSLARLLAYVIEPTDRPGETTRIIAEMAKPDPLQRAESPWRAQQLLQHARRFEERRHGIASVTVARKRRQYQRIPAEISVEVKKRSATPIETGAMLSKIKDIGENGVFVATEGPMPIGSIVELEFAVPGKDAGVHAFGLVRWVSEPPLVRGMGVQFVEVDAVGVETLRAYVQNKDGGE